MDMGVMKKQTKIFKEKEIPAEPCFSIVGLTLAEALAVTLFGVLTVLALVIVRLPLHIPGHTGVLTMAVLTVCCLLIRKPGAGTLAGLVAGFVALLIVPHTKGVLGSFDYVLTGFFLDVLIGAIPVASEKWYSLGIAAGLAHLGKLLVNYAFGIILHIPLLFLSKGLCVALLFYFVFGFAGGAAAYFIYPKVQKISAKQ